MVSISLFIILVFALLTYSLWKYRSLQFSEARFGVIKDLFVRVEQELRSNNRPVEERRTQAIALVLKSLCTLIQLSPWVWVVKKLKFLASDRTHVTTAWYLVPDPAAKRFNIACAAFPQTKMDPQVYDVFQWIKDSYKPAFYDEAEFLRLQKLALGKDPRGWCERLLNMVEQRSNCASCTGYVYAKQCPRMELDAINSIYFDNNFTAQIKEKNSLSKKQLSLLAVGSLIGCPIAGDPATGIGQGVLLVVKNTRNGFQGEDFEVVTLASQIISRIWDLGGVINMKTSEIYHR